MRFTAQEEYGLRCVLALARQAPATSSIAAIAARESLTPAHVAKLLRVLREAGLIESIRGQHGGYRLARSPATISIAEVLDALDGPLYGDAFCDRYAGQDACCVHDTTCALRGLWASVQANVDTLLRRIRLSDLVADVPATVAVTASGPTAPPETASDPKRPRVRKGAAPAPLSRDPATP